MSFPVVNPQKQPLLHSYMTHKLDANADKSINITDILSQLHSPHHTNSPNQAHSKHLKNSKKVYDQLHKNFRNSFNIRKRSMEKSQQQYQFNQQQPITKAQYPQPQKMNKTLKMWPTKQHVNKDSKFPSIPSQQYLSPKSQSEPKTTNPANSDTVTNTKKSSNMQIIKKMLQINHNQKYSQINYKYSDRNSNQDQANSSNNIFHSYNANNVNANVNISQNLRNIYQSGVDGQLYMQSQGNYQELTINNKVKYNRQSLLQKYSQDKQQTSSANKSKLTKYEHQEGTKKQKQSPSRIAPKYPQLHPQQALSNSKPKSKSINKPVNISNNLLSLHSYMLFIHAPSYIKQLNIHFNFDSIRKMSASEVWTHVDQKNGRIIQQILQSIHHILSTSTQNVQLHLQEDQTSYNYDVQIQKKGNVLVSPDLFQLITLYFHNYQKCKQELLLKQHYFKLFAFKLTPIFIYQRIVLYFIYILAEQQLLSNVWYKSRIVQMMAILVQIAQGLAKVVSKVGQWGRNMGHSYNTGSNAQYRITESKIANIMTNTNNGMEQTFQVLRSVGQIQKQISQLQKTISVMIQNSKTPRLLQISKHLLPFLHEQGTSAGSRPYQNLIKTEMLLSWHYLRVPPTPFLPPLNSQLYNYTLVVDLDETLIYYNQATNLLRFRPYLDFFLKHVKDMGFQIVGFSASSKQYTDVMIDQIQRNNKKYKNQRIFQYRLYKEHLSLYQGKLIKDLRRIGRDLKKTIIIDDLQANFCSCPDNGIQVTSWEGQKSDRQLLTILRVLNKLKGTKGKDEEESQNEEGFNDVRKLLRFQRRKLEEMVQIKQDNQFLQ